MVVVSISLCLSGCEKKEKVDLADMHRGHGSAHNKSEGKFNVRDLCPHLPDHVQQSILRHSILLAASAWRTTRHSGPVRDQSSRTRSGGVYRRRGSLLSMIRSSRPSGLTAPEFQNVPEFQTTSISISANTIAGCTDCGPQYVPAWSQSRGELQRAKLPSSSPALPVLMRRVEQFDEMRPSKRLTAIIPQRVPLLSRKLPMRR